MLQTFVNEGKAIQHKTIDVGDLAEKIDVVEFRDGIQVFLVNEQTTTFDYNQYGSVAEAENSLDKRSSKITVQEAKKLVQQFYEHIISGKYQQAYDLIGSPWIDKLSFDEFASGYANTLDIQFGITDVKPKSDSEILVRGALNSTDKSAEALKKNKFTVEYEVENQNGKLVIKKGRGTVIESIEMPGEENKWSFEKWDNANLEERLKKIAGTWERSGLNPRGNGVLVSVSMYIDNQREKLLQYGDKIEQLINAVYDSPELSNYNPQEKCEKELPDGVEC